MFHDNALGLILRSKLQATRCITPRHTTLRPSPRSSTDGPPETDLFHALDKLVRIPEPHPKLFFVSLNLMTSQLGLTISFFSSTDLTPLGFTFSCGTLALSADKEGRPPDGTRLAAPRGVKAGDDADGGKPRVSSAGNARPGRLDGDRVRPDGVEGGARNVGNGGTGGRSASDAVARAER